MGMDIANNAQSKLAALLPEWTIASTVEDDNATVEAAWIEVVIEDKALNPAAMPIVMTKEKCPAFTASSTTAA